MPVSVYFMKGIVMKRPLMPKATAVWLIENTALTFDQIANFCQMHPLEVQAIADGDTAARIMGFNPIINGQLTAEEIKRCEKNPKAQLELIQRVELEQMKKAKKSSPATKSARLGAIAWMIQNHPELSDAQIVKLMHTTRTVINGIRMKTHKDMASIRAMHPVENGLLTEEELNNALAVAVKIIPIK